MQTLALVEGAATAMSAPHIGHADIARARAINELMIELDQLTAAQHPALRAEVGCGPVIAAAGPVISVPTSSVVPSSTIVLILPKVPK